MAFESKTEVDMLVFLYLKIVYQIRADEYLNGEISKKKENEMALETHFF